MDDREISLFFRYFNEIGIIHQLTTSLLAEVLPDGLIPPHFTVLNHLIRVQDGQTPLKMARAFQVPKTSLTHTLSGLEAGGYVEMRANPNDARSKQVWLTQKGRALHRETILALAPAMGDLAGAIDIGEVEKALPLLEDTRKYLDQRRDG